MPALPNPNDVDAYQHWCATTAIFPQNSGIAYCAIKLSGEVGEFNEKIGKLVRDQANGLDNGSLIAVITEEQRVLLAKELGDICWYVGQLARQLGFSMSDVLDINIQKLNARRINNTISGSGDER